MSARILSVVVCTYNRMKYLPQCLKSLTSQDVSASDFEIIVVDNNSTDGTAPFLLEWSGLFSNVKIVHEGKQGLSHARNAGVAAADADLIAFVDDDATAPPIWAGQMMRVGSELADSFAVFGGDCNPVWETPRPSWLTDDLLHPLSARLGWSKTARRIVGDEWLFEGNSCYRKKPLLEHGGFPTQLGRSGSSLLSGDGAVNFVMAAAGYQFYYDPSIIIDHYISADRMNQSWFRRRLFWQGVSSYNTGEYLRQQGATFNRLREVALPSSADAWARIFDDDLELRPQLGHLYDLGYLLASQKVI